MISKSEKQTEVTADLTNVQRKMSQRRTSDKQVKEVGADKQSETVLDLSVTGEISEKGFRKENKWITFEV